MAELSNIEQIAEYRDRIDEVDDRIVNLLNERALLSLKIRELKPGAHMGLYDPRREERILQRVGEHGNGPLYSEHLREIYATILKVMKEAPSL